jgi:hypothetical protein
LEYIDFLKIGQPKLFEIMNLEDGLDGSSNSNHSGSLIKALPIASIFRSLPLRHPPKTGKVDGGQVFWSGPLQKFARVLTYKISSSYTPILQKEVLIREHLANAAGLYPSSFCRAGMSISNLEKGGMIMKTTTAPKMSGSVGDLIRRRYGKDSAVGVIARGRLDGFFEQK